MSEQTQVKVTPRTMSAEREAEIRASMIADYDYGDVERISGEGQEVLIELSAERAVSAALLQALKFARNMLDECCNDAVGMPTEAVFAGAVAECDRAINFVEGR